MIMMGRLLLIIHLGNWQRALSAKFERTTLIAAQTTSRACVGIEVDPAYVDVAVKRWQAFAGEKAIRLGEECPFDECSAVTPPEGA